MNFFIEAAHAMGQAPAAAGAEQPSTLGMFLPFILIFVVMYFLVLRPQKKQQKEAQEMRASLKKGDEVVTLGGIYGTVKGVNDESLQIEIAKGVIVNVAKNSVSAQMKQEEEK